MVFQNKKFLVACLLIFLAYLLLYSPCGVYSPFHFMARFLAMAELK